MARDARLRIAVHDNTLRKGTGLSGELPWGVLFLLFNVAVAWNDWRRRRVPNRLLAGALAMQGAWLAAAWLMATAPPAPSASGLLPALAGALLALLSFLPAWRLGWMGAGDVKYLATLGWLLGPWGMIAAALGGSVAGGLHALALLATGARHGRGRGRRVLPHAAHLALAAVAWAVWRMQAG